MAAHSTPLSAGFRTLCADILKSRFSFRLCREAPPFFPQRKGGKKRQGALPPEPPGGFVDFLSMKIDSDAATRTGLYKKGLRPQGLGLFPVGTLTSPAPARHPLPFTRLTEFCRRATLKFDQFRADSGLFCPENGRKDPVYD